MTVDVADVSSVLARSGESNVAVNQPDFMCTLQHVQGNVGDFETLLMLSKDVLIKMNFTLCAGVLRFNVEPVVEVPVGGGAKLLCTIKLLFSSIL